MIARILHWFCHLWESVRDTGKTVYEECVVCKKRRVRQRPGGAQPIDEGWLKTGKWTPAPTVGPQAGSGVVRLPRGGSSTARPFAERLPECEHHWHPLAGECLKVCCHCAARRADGCGPHTPDRLESTK